MIEKKKEMQIRRAILKFEKEQDIYPPNYLAFSHEEDTKLDGMEKDTRKFHIKILIGIPNDYHSGGYVVYIVTDHETSIKYKVRHYFPNVHFDNTYGWHLEVNSDVEVKKDGT